MHAHQQVAGLPSSLSPGPGPAPAPGVEPDTVRGIAPWRAVLAGVASVVVPGGGQLVLGQWVAGVIWLVGGVAGYFVLIVPGVVVQALSLIFAARASWLASTYRPCLACMSRMHRAATVCPQCQRSQERAPTMPSRLPLFLMGAGGAVVVGLGLLSFR